MQLNAPDHRVPPEQVQQGAKTLAKHNASTAYERGEGIQPARYAREFIPWNAKGTNDHIERWSLAYLYNVFHNSMIKGHFTDGGIPVPEELYALSEMIQWVWRSQIRDWKPINLFIPSKRMRELFIRWLNSASVTELIQEVERAA